MRLHGMNCTPVYLDYQATTPIDPRAKKAMMPFLSDMFGNPHSQDHEFGWTAARAIKSAREHVASLINADDDEIVFTSGATESCNLALRGVANYSRGGGRDRIVTVATEHPAVLETVMDLGQSGFETVILPVDGSGLLNPNDLAKVLDDRTLLVSVMVANNEIGVLQPVADIATQCHAAGALFHTDATQAVGRIHVDVDSWNVDLLSYSSHKVYGPKGVGALFVRSGLELQPVITGGPQERGLRGGTLPTPQVVGFGAACQVAMNQQEHDQSRMETLTTRLLMAIRESHPDVRLFGNVKHRLPGSLNIGFPGLSAEEAIQIMAGSIAVSSGAACTSSTFEPSRVLLALGLGLEDAASGIRISLGRFTTENEVDRAITALSNLRPVHQRFPGVKR